MWDERDGERGREREREGFQERWGGLIGEGEAHFDRLRYVPWKLCCKTLAGRLSSADAGPQARGQLEPSCPRSGTSTEQFPGTSNASTHRNTLTHERAHAPMIYWWHFAIVALTFKAFRFDTGIRFVCVCVCEICKINAGTQQLSNTFNANMTKLNMSSGE